jgi:adenylate cyclase
MKWWGRSSLRSKIFLAFAALILAVLIAALGLTQYVLSREAEHTLNQNLFTTSRLFNQLMSERAARLRTNATLLASDFALKRVVATYYNPATYEPSTLASVAVNYQQRIGVELLWIVSDTGALLAAAPNGVVIGAAAAEFSPIREALKTRESATAIAVTDGHLFQLVAVPVLAPDVIGYLVFGQIVDDAFALRLKEGTGSDVSFLTSTRVFASSLPAPLRYQLAPAGAARNALWRQNAAPKTHLLEAAGKRFLTRVIPVPANLSQPMFALVLRSYDAALAPLRALQWRIVLIGALALAGALLAGSALAGGITSPVKSLVAGMHEVIDGNLKYRSNIARDDEIGFLARSFNDMVRGLEEREHIKDTFGRFVSRDVATAVLSGQVPLAGERREVSILFQDIRGFTGISEKLDPATLLRLLNQFFTEAVAAVEAEGGVVKQFTGDGLMALFGVPYPCADHAERAVRAALGIVKRLEPLNDNLLRQNLPALAIGAGIHSGEVIAGLIGPDSRVEYGVVGESVNLASRIESFAKELHAVVLVSREIAARIGPRFVLGRSALMSVKGSRQSLEVVEVLDIAR